MIHKPNNTFLLVFMTIVLLLVASCGVISTTYDITKGTISAGYNTVKFISKLGVGAVVVSYKIGKFTFDVLSAPEEWPMTSDIDTIDGLSPKEAIKQGRVKRAPYTIKGKRYVPMTIAAAQNYNQVGTASWYGYETLRQKGGHMTANGEAFDPGKPTAAHKLLPLPTHVRVTNLHNGRSMVLRVNDRGPFIEGRIIDLSAGAAQKLGFYKQGTAKVRVETVQI